MIDLGVSGGAKYTLGGWRTSVSDAEVDGVSATISRGTTGFVVFGWPSDEEATMRLRVRTPHAGPLMISLNDHDDHSLQIEQADTWTELDLLLPTSELRRGENKLRFRVRRTAAHASLGRVGASIDWIQIGPSAQPLTATAVPSPTSLSPETAGVPSLNIPGGWSLGFAMRVPSSARLRGISGEGSSPVHVRVTRTDGAERRVGELGPGPFDLDLQRFAGEVVRLDLSAPTGEATLVRPAIVTPAEPEVQDPPRIRNVLLYLIDTLRADKLSPYNGDTRVRTPGLSQFIESAVTMLGAHSQENWTKPSVATLMTSLMPWEHTATRGESVLPQSVNMIPEILSEAGYRTGCFIANGYVSDRFGFHQGWGYYRNYIRERRRTDAEYVAADALRWLDDQPEDQPFFLYVHTIDPHVPYRPPDGFLHMYDDQPYRGPVSFRRDATLLENIKIGRIDLNARDRQRLEALYDGEISYHDVHFNAILEGLSRRGHADDTLVIVTSDHGEEFWDHGSVGHGHSVYEELLRVPLFIRVPGVTRGMTQIEGAVGLVDVLPTILETLELPIPDDISGTSFAGRLRGADERHPPATVSGFMENWRTVVLDDWKLIQQRLREPRVYDLREDRGEQTDVAETAPITTRWLRGELGLALDASRPTHRRRRRPRRHRAEETAIDPELEAQLRALGYIGTSRPE